MCETNVNARNMIYISAMEKNLKSVLVDTRNWKCAKDPCQYFVHRRRRRNHHIALKVSHVFSSHISLALIEMFYSKTNSTSSVLSSFYLVRVSALYREGNGAVSNGHVSRSLKRVVESQSPFCLTGFCPHWKDAWYAPTLCLVRIIY